MRVFFGSKWAIFCSKIFNVQAKGGSPSAPPPKYATACVCMMWLQVSLCQTDAECMQFEWFVDCDCSVV